MSIEKARELAAQLVVELGPAPPAQPPASAPVIDTADGLERALLAAPPGAVLSLAPTLRYPKPLVLKTPVTLQVAGPLLDTRVTLAQALPQFLGGVTIPGDDVTLLGLDIRHTDPGRDILTYAGARTTLDRCRIMGDPVRGAKRGVGANGNGGAKILRCYMDDCFQPSPGMDSQAICAWDMGPGLLIENNFLRAGSETILLGGADQTSADRMPADIIIRGNTITANPEWQGQPIGVKTRLEIKCGRNVLIEKNIIEYCWAQGQAGYLCSLTVRNQSGRSPWDTIENVIIQDNAFAHGAGAINLLAMDNNNISGRMTGVQFLRNTFKDLDATKWSKTGALPTSMKMILVGQGPVDITLDHNVFEGVKISSQIYFYGTVPTRNFVVTNNTWPKSTYGIFGEGASVGKAWAFHAPDGTLTNNTEVASGG